MHLLLNAAVIPYRFVGLNVRGFCLGMYSTVPWVTRKLVFESDAHLLGLYNSGDFQAVARQ